MRFAVLTATLCLVLVSGVLADLGPKPTVSFSFDPSPGPDFSCANHGRFHAADNSTCQLLQCDSATCANATPLGNYGPQSFGCGDATCGALAYGFAPYGRLRLQFGDQVLESNTFTIGHDLTQSYVVTRSGNSLSVRESAASVALGTVSPFALLFQDTTALIFFIALVFTVVIEIGCAWLFLKLTKRPVQWVRSVLVANLISLPIVWYIIIVGELSTLSWIIAEAFAILGEACWYHWRHKDELPWTSAFIFSVVANLASLLVGGILLAVLALVFFLH